jgi:hypothetical protein
VGNRKLVEKSGKSVEGSVEPNPPTPFSSREGGEFKPSLLAGERFGERFAISE